MKRNVGTVDRIARLVLGLAALAWAAAMGWSSAGTVVLLVLAGTLLVTAAAGFCPLYHLLGISTHRPGMASTASTPASTRGDHAARH